jgi:hypothetical protein
MCNGFLQAESIHNVGAFRRPEGNGSVLIWLTLCNLVSSVPCSVVSKVLRKPSPQGPKSLGDSTEKVQIRTPPGKYRGSYASCLTLWNECPRSRMEEAGQRMGALTA